MRGGRNKFGPLYRRDRQMKQQKGLHQTNAEPQMKAKSPHMHRPSPPHDLQLMGGHTSSDAARQASYPSGPGQSFGPMPRDCTINPDDGFTSPPSLPYPGLYHRTFPGYFQDKGELPYSFSMAAAMYPVHQSPHSSFPYRSTPPSSSMSSASLSSPPPPPRTPAQTPDASLASTATENFLSQLLEGEQDESQLCAKVMASLQREQANRGKHDRLNTFSIMCKMADQTLFGLVEWARNSALFKELTVKRDLSWPIKVAGLAFWTYWILLCPQVEDQMVLLQSCWSELLVLDHLCRQVIYSKEGCIYLVSGQQVKSKRNLNISRWRKTVHTKCYLMGCAQKLILISTLCHCDADWGVNHPHSGRSHTERPGFKDPGPGLQAEGTPVRQTGICLS